MRTMPSLASLGRNGWTGGQASLARVALGLALLAGWAWGLAGLLAAIGSEALEDPGPAGGLDPLTPGGAILLALMLAALVATVRVTLGSAGVPGHALVMGAVTTAALMAPALHLVLASVTTWSLALHMTMPRAPILSVAARGRVDPGGGWQLDGAVFETAWLGLGVVATLAAIALPFAPPTPLDRVAHAALPVALLGLHPRTRPAAWLVSAAALTVLTARHGHPLTVVVTLAALLAFADPAWIASRRRDDDPLVFFDGTCGLCHGFVRLLVAEDADARLRFAPLHGRAFETRVPEAARAGLPDSIVLSTTDGALRVRSDAVLELLARLGGAWRVLGALARPIPRPLRDLAYDGVARVRRRLFATPEAACPVLPEGLAARFEA